MRYERMHWGMAVVLVVGLVGLSCSAIAEKPGLPEWTDDVKNPTDWFDWGFDFRLRFEDYPGALLIDRDTPGPIDNWWRIRTRIWGNLKPHEDFKFTVRLANEAKLPQTPENYRPSTHLDRYEHFDQTVVDNLYITWKHMMVEPLTLRLGRFDMLAIPGTTGPNGVGFGEGLIFMDASPADGSTTFYFDAARLTIDLSEWVDDSSLDLFIIDQTPFSQQHIDTIGWHNGRRIEELDSEAYCIYFKNASWIPKSQLDLYYIYKEEDNFEFAAWEPVRPLRYSEWGTDFSTIGARLSGKVFTDNTSYALEAAFQFGDWNGNGGQDLNGWATEQSIKHMFDVWGKPWLKLHHAFLSGDDPNTLDYEGWRQLYGRWPKWGELIGYMGPRENGIYYFNNMQVLGLHGGFSPHETVSVTGILQYLRAEESTFGTVGSTVAANTNFFGTGDERGFNPQALVEWAPTKYFKTHLRFEYLDAGDYYGPVSRDSYYFARWEAYFRF